MHCLHIVSPSPSLTSQEVLGLLRLVQQQIAGSHKTIVLGNDDEGKRLRNRGINVLGTVGGVRDASNTLLNRVNRLISSEVTQGITFCMAWGWHSARIVSGLGTELETVAFVDEVEKDFYISNTKTRFIPTSWSGANYLKLLGVSESSLYEPMIGLDPSPLVANKTDVLKELQLDSTNSVVTIVGTSASWKEIIEMAYRIHPVNTKIVFVLPINYSYRGQLMIAAKERNLTSMFRTTPPSLRMADVNTCASCAWAPSTAPFDKSFGVLELLKTAWDGVPIAVQTTHPIYGLPSLGTSIACAKDILDISKCILDIALKETSNSDKVAELTSNVREIASPARFIEGLQQRITSTPSFSG
jgi:hypothetical protein